MTPLAEVDLGAISSNLARLRAAVGPGVELLAAVKADAYGHGLVPVGRHLSREGVRWFGVATPDEALTLRREGVAGRILLFGPARARVRQLIRAGVDLTVTDEHDLDAIVAARADAPARVHLKVDTGMGRLGRPPEEAVRVARALQRSPAVEWSAAWTHFACADLPDAGVTEQQLSRFRETLSHLAEAELEPPLRHAANSAAVLAFPETHFDLVRPGLSLYGYPPSSAIGRLVPDLRPALRLTAPVVFVKRVRAGTPISYHHTWRAPRDTTIATVRCGYGDGYPRRLGGRATARLGDALVDVVGVVCMDQLFLDVGDAPVRVGDRVSLIDPRGPRADELAARFESIAYELLTAFTARVPHRYRFGPTPA